MDTKFWNNNLKRLSPYIPGEQPKDTTRLIKLNTNENPYPPSPKVMDRLGKLNAEALLRYPDPRWTKLRSSLSNRYGMPVSQIFCGNGSDEILALIFKAFLSPTDLVIFPYPNYSLYEVLADSFGVPYDYVQSGDDFLISFDSLLEKESKAIFFSNPNAPTGRFYPVDDIYRFCQRYSGLFVLDEAYIDFGGESGIKLLDKLDNLLVIRTFSKSFSLAAARLGYAFSSESIIEGMMRMKDSYNLNYISQEIGYEAVQDFDYMVKNSQDIVSNRNYLTEELKQLGFDTIDSRANFIFTSHPTHSAKDIFKCLRDQGIFVRYFDHPRLTNHIRITIGKRGDLNALLEAVRIIVSEGNQ